MFTINTKNLHGDVWVAARVILHNGHRTPFLPRAVQEAERVAARLGRALSRPVLVTPVLAIFSRSLTIKSAPEDVQVVRAHGIAPWLEDRPATLERAAAFEIARAAADPATW